MDLTAKSETAEGRFINNKRKSDDVLDVAEDLSCPVKKINAGPPAAVVEKSGSDSVASAAAFQNFGGLSVKSILSNSADYKRIVVEGAIGDQKAVVILDKKPFTEEILKDLFSEKSELIRTFQNDIYGSYDCLPERKTSAIKTTIVYPATQKHIDKYKQQPWFLVDETPEIYDKVTLPYLNSHSFDIQWVFNILEHKKEKERIVFEDPCPTNGFVLLPDLKWDGITQDNLYLVAIIHQKGLKSLRDLKAEHLPLLSNILASGTKAIQEKYGLKQAQLRIYIHYQPSYYHLHVHFTALSFNAPGINAEKSHLLQTVIENIKQSPSYYQDSVLPFVVTKNQPLYTQLVEYGYDL